MPISPLVASSAGPLGADPLRSSPGSKNCEPFADAHVASSFTPPLRQSGTAGPLAADVSVLLPASRASADPLSALKQKREVERHERSALATQPALVDRGLESLGPCLATDAELLRPPREIPEQVPSGCAAPTLKQAEPDSAPLKSSNDVAGTSTTSAHDRSDSSMKLQDFLGDLGDETCLQLKKENADELIQALGGHLSNGSQAKSNWSEYSCDVEEGDVLQIGPFEPGRKVEILSATFGPQDDKLERINVTETLRRRWCDKKGLRVENIRSLLDADDAVMTRPGADINVLSVRCRVGVPGHDVATATYSEGIGRVARTVPLVTKALANVVGATLAASGYAVAKVQQTMGPQSDGESSVADSEAFQWGFASWLRLNGVEPHVTYEPTGNAGIRLRWLYSQSWGPSEVPKSTPPADDMKQTPLIVANHISYIDPMVLTSVLGVPKVLAKAGTLQVPLIGRFAKDIGCIEVDRSSRDSRAATMETISAHVDSWRPGFRPLLLFPEGTTSNGDNVLEFKKGAFAPGAPVRPVVICYTSDWNPAAVNFKMSQKGEIRQTSDAEWAEQFLNHIIHSLEVKVLPPYIPNEEEKKDPVLFAANVRKLITEVYLQMRESAEASRQAKAREKPLASFLKTLSRIPG